MMKIALIIGAMTSIFLFGCSSQNTSQSNPAQVGEIKTVEQEANENVISESAASTIVDKEAIALLESEIAVIEEEVANAEASGTNEENMTAFLAIDHELELIEEKLDQFEDDLEANYLENTISAEQYKEKELQLEQLENRLDAAENTLEIKFKIED